MARMMARLKSWFLKCARMACTNSSKILAAFLVHPYIADHGIFMGAGRDKNQNRIAIPRFLHAELEESLSARGKASSSNLPR